MDELKTNVLYYGDNLEILRKYIPDNSIDLIYLDPPFSSKKDYNIIFRKPTGKEPEAQIKAFSDTWHWESAKDTYDELLEKAPENVAELIKAMYKGIDRNDLMAYLVMMTIRLLGMKRVLKDTGSLYLHCDPTASHYLKLVLDQVFGPKSFRNEIVWCYRAGGVPKKGYPRKHDTLFFYTKTKGLDFTFNPEYVPYTKGTVERGLTKVKGKYFAKGLRTEGTPIQDWWVDLQKVLSPTARETLGYPTQKPLSLLERIIKASSNEGDVVLDPFCGCGTALVAAQKLNRRWIGIDITYLAIEVMQKRLKDSFPGIQFEIEGLPKDLEGARALADRSRTQFELWALGLVGAKPLGKRDGGVDGVIDFQEDATNWAKVAVQVKSGIVTPGLIRDLEGVLANKNYAIGIFMTLNPPTSGMKREAADAGRYRHPFFGQDYPKIQILTIEELLRGEKPNLPPRRAGLLPDAPKLSKEQGEQIALEGS